MRPFEQLRFLGVEGVRRLAERVIAEHGPALVKMALSETAPGLRRHVLEALGPEQKRAVAEARAPEGISHAELPAARGRIMQVADRMERAGEIAFG
jgi:flagellar motor switch protein FliG